MSSTEEMARVLFSAPGQQAESESYANPGVKLAQHEMLVSLTRGLVTIIDKADWPLISTRSWQAHPRRDNQGFYAVSDGLRMHRLLLCPGDDEIVDHINGNGLDNRRINLRVGTQSQNCVNRKRTPGPYPRGVSRKGNRWRAQIKFRGLVTSLGYFRTPEDAHQAYLAAAIALHGDWMPLPPPPRS